MKSPEFFPEIIRKVPWWLPVLAVAFLLRVVVLASGAVSFHSDEAIVGLMARHITLGKPIPIFFYGQPYMGSLDPLLVSVAFRIFGESVVSIRLVQSALYLGIVGSTMALAIRMTDDRRIASIAGLMLAIPPVVMTLYTTISLGGYGEVLILGNLLLLVAHYLEEHANVGWRWWILPGALAGLGWWTNNLIVVYAVPAGLLLLYALYKAGLEVRRGMLRGIGVSAVAFMLFSAPWWLYNLSHNWESVRFLTGGFQAPAGAQGTTVADRLFGFFFIGLPAVMGVRFSWQIYPWAGWAAAVVYILYCVIVLSSLIFRTRPAYRFHASAIAFLWLVVGTFAAIFVLSSFGVDSTGRYLLPLLTPVAILIGIQMLVWRRRRAIPVAVLMILIGVNLLGTVTALRTVPPGLTPQFDPATDFPNDSDQAAIQFLKEKGGTRGYATYWAAYRLTFLSQETVILSPMLPYKATLLYTATDRYPDYTALVQSAERPVFISANLPALDAAIQVGLDGAGITFKIKRIGPFTIFYDLSRRTDPFELELQRLSQTQ